MKKTVRVKDLCCQRCAKSLTAKLELEEGILKAKANYKKNVVFVEVKSGYSDEELCAVVTRAGYQVTDIADRKGLFA